MIVRFANDGRHVAQAEQLRRAPPALTRNQFVVIGPLTNDERLHDALLLDRVGQFAQRVGREIFARLKWTRPDALNRNAVDPFARIDFGLRRRRRDRGGGRGRRFEVGSGSTQERTQPTP